MPPNIISKVPAPHPKKIFNGEIIDKRISTIPITIKIINNALPPILPHLKPR